MSPVRQIRQPRREDAGLPAAARHGAGRSLHPMDKKGPAIEVRGGDRIALSLQKSINRSNHSQEKRFIADACPFFDFLLYDAGKARAARRI